MGNSVSRVLGCLGTQAYEDGEGPAVTLSDTLDEGLGHSFCYIRPALESPSLSPSHSQPGGESVEKSAAETDLSEYVPHENKVEESMVKSRSGVERGAGEKSRVHTDRPRSSFEKPKPVSETSFKSISGASVSANTATPRSIVSNEQFVTFSTVPFDRAADFKSTASFAALPLQPVPKHSGSMSGPLSSGPLSGPLDRGFLSGPLERGFMSGPLERGFLSGPLERGFLSGPLEPVDRSHFSAPLGGRYSGYLRRRRRSLSNFVKAVSRPLRRAIAKTSARLIRSQRRSLAADKQFRDVQESPPDTGYTSSELETRGNDNLQWAQGKAGEDRVHVVLSEEHGWLFVGIYDGFNGPDAPDFLMSNLYPAIYRELKGLLWDQDGFVPCYAGTVDDLQEPETCVPENASAFRLDVLCEAENKLLTHGGCSWEDGRIGNVVVVAGEGLGLGVVPEDLRSVDDSAEGTGCTIEDQTGLIASTLVPTGELYGLHRQQIEVPVANQSIRPQGEKSTEPEVLHQQTPEQECTTLCSGESRTRVSTAASQYSVKPTIDASVRQHLERRKPKEHSKYLQWRYDWEQDKSDGRVNTVQGVQGVSAQPLSWSKGVADHRAVLGALARALATTEDAYLDMADQALDEYPELALMGSCVLVMLMKDEDVYIMNVGDSRAILAQHSKMDNFDVLLKPHRVRTGLPNPSKADDHDRVGPRDSILHLELERIIEETPTELEALEAYDKGNMTLPCTAQFLGALQLSSDHSTSIDEVMNMNHGCCFYWLLSWMPARLKQLHSEQSVVPVTTPAKLVCV